MFKCETNKYYQSQHWYTRYSYFKMIIYLLCELYCVKLTSSTLLANCIQTLWFFYVLPHGHLVALNVKMRERQMQVAKCFLIFESPINS